MKKMGVSDALNDEVGERFWFLYSGLTCEGEELEKKTVWGISESPTKQQWSKCNTFKELNLGPKALRYLLLTYNL